MRVFDKISKYDRDRAFWVSAQNFNSNLLLTTVGSSTVYIARSVNADSDYDYQFPNTKENVHISIR